jgi:hypothetical protein
MARMEVRGGSSRTPARRLRIPDLSLYGTLQSFAKIYASCLGDETDDERGA